MRVLSTSGHSCCSNLAYENGAAQRDFACNCGETREIPKKQSIARCNAAIRSARLRLRASPIRASSEARGGLRGQIAAAREAVPSLGRHIGLQARELERA